MSGIRPSDRKYAVERIRIIQRDHENAVNADLQSRLKPEPSTADKLEQIRTGRAKLQRERAITTDTACGWPETPDLFDVFDFPGEDKRQQLNADLQAKSEARIAAIRDEARRLTDDIVLGDANNALNRINEFAKRRF